MFSRFLPRPSATAARFTSATTGLAAEPETKDAAKSDLSDDAALALITAPCLRVAEGDLEARIIGLTEHPRFGPTAIAINNALDRVDSYVRETAASMQHCSDEQFHRPILLRGMTGAYRQSALIINQAGSKMQANHNQLGVIATLAQENSASVSTVAAACEELHATSGEISHQVADTTRLTGKVMTDSESAVQAVAAMNAAATRAEALIGLINKVAEQTNLLAINATISAARAGEHGRRFAVVATEVKQLASNTAAATEDIRQQVSAIQQCVADVEKRIAAMNHSIGEIHRSTDSISHSVQQQVVATNEITRTISDVSANTKKVSDQINHAVK